MKANDYHKDLKQELSTREAIQKKKNVYRKTSQIIQSQRFFFFFFLAKIVKDLYNFLSKELYQNSVLILVSPMYKKLDSTVSSSHYDL